MSSSKVEANRKNSRKSTGPRDTLAIRRNASKHGLCARGLTELDDVERYRESLERLTAEKKPEGEVETYLVESIALGMVRVRRARRIEAEYITEQLSLAKSANSPELLVEERGCPVIDAGLPAPLKKHMVEPLVGTYQRYGTAIENDLYRAMNQLERLQRMRQGERLPAPAAVDVAIHSK
jgi:hypothetical protein